MQATNLQAATTPLPPPLGCTTCGNNPRQLSIPPQPPVSVNTKTTPATSFLGNNGIGELRSVQSKNIVERAESKMQLATNRPEASVLHRNAQLDAKQKELNNKLQNHQAVVKEQRQMSLQDFNNKVNASLKGEQLAKKHQRPLASSSSSSSASAAAAAASKPTIPMQARPPIVPPQLPATNSLLSNSTTSSSLNSNSKIDLSNFRNQMSQIRDLVSNQTKDTESQKTAFQSKFAELQQKGAEDLNRTVASTETSMNKLSEMLKSMEGFREKFAQVADHSAKAGQAMTLVSDVVRSVQTVNQDPNHYSARIQRGPLRAVQDSIMSEWYQKMENQQKLNVGSTFIAREDEGWFNDQKKKRAMFEWKDHVVQDSQETCHLYAVGNGYMADTQTESIVVGKFTYLPHTATFEMDAKWNGMKTKMFNGFSTASQVLLYSSPSEFQNDIILILGTTEVNKRYHACLLALDAVTGEKVNDFFPVGEEKSAIWGLAMSHHLYGGSHGVRMSLHPETNELLLLCELLKLNAQEGPQMQTVVMRMDNRRNVITPFKQATQLSPIVELSQLSNTLSQYTFIGYDIAWLSSGGDDKKFVVCGSIHYPRSQIEWSRGFIVMFNEHGKPCLGGRHTEEPMPALHLSGLNSTHSTPRSAASGFYVTMDGTKSSSSTSQSVVSLSTASPSHSPLSSPYLQPQIDLQSQIDVETKEENNKAMDEKHGTPVVETKEENQPTFQEIPVQSLSLDNTNNKKPEDAPPMTMQEILKKRSLQEIMGKPGTIPNLSNTTLSKPPQQKQFHTLDTIRPTQFRPLVAKAKENSLHTSTTHELLGSGYVGQGMHIVEFENVPNLVLQRVRVQADNIVFLGTAFPTPNNVHHGFPFVGCLDFKNEKMFNITVLPNSSHQQSNITAKDFVVTPRSDIYIVGQAYRDPTDSDTTSIALIRFQQQALNIYESWTFPLRGDYYQCLSSIKYSSKLKALVSVGSSQTRPYKDERKGVMTVTTVV